MAKGLRHEDPRCGREHFDARAGIDWERGPDPNDTAYATPDTPWNQKPGSKLLFVKYDWAVTDFGLELLSDSQELWERYRIPGHELLEMHGLRYKWPVRVAKEPWANFDAFEEMFRKAIQVHYVKLSPEEDDILDVSFHEARAIVAQRTLNAR
jgi:hypothetical protein